MSEKVKNILAAALTALTLFITAVCFFCTLSHIGVKAQSNPMLYIGAVAAGTLFLCAAIILLYKAVDRLSRKGLIILCAAVFGFIIFAEAVVVLNFQSVPMTDSYRCIDLAMSFADGDLNSVGTDYEYVGYFMNYSNNNMFIFVLTLFYKAASFFGIKNYIFASFVLNALAVFAGIGLMFLAATRLAGLRKAVKMLILCALNPVFYLYVPWIYTISLSFPFMAGIVLLCAEIYKAKSVKRRAVYSSALGAVSALAFLLRVTSVFPVIAFAAVLVLNVRASREYLKKAAQIAVLFAAAFLVVYAPVKSLANKPFESTLKYNFPVTHWIMMGLHGDGKFNMADSAFTHSFETKEEKEQANIMRIKQSLSEYAPLGLFAHMMKKTAVTWSDGTNGYTWRLKINKNYTGLYSYVAGEKKEPLMFYSQIFRSATYLFMIICLVKLLMVKNRCKSRLLPMAITMFGAFLFYAAWEAKAEYSTPFLPIMILMASFGADYAVTKLGFARRAKSGRRFERVSAVAASALVAVTACGTFAFYGVTKNERNVVCTPAIITKSNSDYEPIDSISDMKNGIKQIFYTDRPFNRMYIDVQKTDPKNAYKQNKKVEYLVTLSDESKKTLLSERVKASDISKGMLCFKLDKTEVPNDRKRYRIKIKRTSLGNKDTVRLKRNIKTKADVYKGALYADSKRITGNLNLKIVDEHFENGWDTGYYPALLAICMGCEIFVTCLLIYFGWRRGGKTCPGRKTDKPFA